jgi:hypothetical protein
MDHHRKRRFQQYLYCLNHCCGDVFVCEHYPAMALVYLLISWSLPSHDSTRYTISLIWKLGVNVKPLKVMFQSPINNSTMAKQKSLPLDLALTEMNAVFTLHPITLRPILISSCHLGVFCILFSFIPCLLHASSHVILFELIALIIFG